MRTLWLFVRWFFLGLVAVASFSQTAPQPFSLAITTKTPTVAVGSHLKVQIVLTNTSSNTIVITRDKSVEAAEQAGFSATVLDSSGKQVPYTSFGDKFFKGELITISTPFQVPMKPGEALKQEINITKLYNLSVSGVYTIQLQRKDEASAAVFRSNILTVTVTPANP